MGSDHRKLLYKPTSFGNATTGCYSCCYRDGNNKEQCFSPLSKPCPPSCVCLVLLDAPPVIRPSSKGLPPPVVAPLPHDNDTSLRELAIAGLTILACVVIAALLFCLLCAVGRAFYLRRNRSRRRNRPIIFDTQENFFDEDHGPEVDHHIWYINTVGLPHSIIDSITVFKYKKDEGLIDGTECSVCLNEFEEDESLRLLPKCSHAFHIPCIDTWLRSHKNCPLCRAPIISGAVVAQASESGSSSGGLDSRNENMVQSLGNYSGEGSNDLEEGGTSDIRIGHDSNSALSSDEEASAAESSNKSFRSRLKTRNGDSDSRVLSDLTDNRRGIEGDMQPMRRSVSLDSPSALMIYNDIAGGGVPDKHQGSVDTQIVNSKNLKSNSVSKRGSGSSSISKLMKSASIGIGTSLQKGPILMKRSFSSGRKVSSSRHGRRHSIIPLQK